MSAPQNVTLKLDVDNTDALRKIREVRREASRLRRGVDGPWWSVLLGIVQTFVALACGVVGVAEHSAYYVALGCMLLLLGDR